MLTIFALLAASDWIDRLGAADPAAREEAMRNLLAHPETEFELCARLSETSLEARLRIEWLTGEWGNERARRVIREHVRFEKPYVLGPPKWWLDDLLSNDPSRVAGAIWVALIAPIRHPYALGRQLFCGSPDPTPRSGGHLIWRICLDRLQDDPAWTVVRMRLLEAATLVSDRVAATRFIVDQLFHADPEVRAEAIRQAAMQGGYLAPSVAGLLNDPVQQVRIEALTALACYDMKASPFLGEIRSLMDDPDEIIRVNALDALFALSDGTRSRQSLLLEGAADPSGTVRSWTMTIVRYWSAGSRARPLAERLLADPDPHVRARAQCALNHIVEGTEAVGLCEVCTPD